ncbi:FtsX-like permease family protein [Fimbriiglobus ruber]|uniref:Lipoprotein releasing system transmembrane protein LolC n=1 Tax=Fimbriiglobus ruber TaxID=1908690 RepID=A0A225DRL2_9BACT|nr:FtsX-like permease family protein [Fimbriiglobus ruber]OWK43941.1 Lipoprotein releasing system transmembrane protein LolC [Fimbriiglobus ruber]
MYKLFLCLRYLRTRYLAFVCIVSVMLGVATLIVVNSVMSGFSNKLRDRLHGILADVMCETDRADGLDERPEHLMARIAASPAGQHVEAMSPTVEVFALLQFQVRDRIGRKIPITKHVRLIGVDPAKHAAVGRFADYLVRQNPKEGWSGTPSFELTPKAKERAEWLRNMAEIENHPFGPAQPAGFPIPNNGPFPTTPAPPLVVGPQPTPAEFSPFDTPPSPSAGALPAPVIPVIPGGALPKPKPDGAFEIPVAPVPPPLVLPPPDIPAPPPPRLPGVILGYSIAHPRYPDANGVVREIDLLKEGDDVLLATVGATGDKVVFGSFAVCDCFKSDMSEYDGSFVYVPLEELQRMRGMDGRVNVIQMKLKDGVAKDSWLVNKSIVPDLQSLVGPEEARVMTWQQHQGPLLAAIDIERKILNILLFMIVGVSGFSVLAIFSMIVSEKYRDIGVLKSLGASNQGVMSIFLSYGLLLGLVGSLLGTVLGLLITEYINELEAALSMLTGQQIFDRSIYYFDKIPTNVEPLSIVIINAGAVITAVLFSVLPAFRAARLHPVRALRFE